MATKTHAELHQKSMNSGPSTGDRESLLRSKIVEVLSNTANGCLKELGYFPGMPARLQQTELLNVQYQRDMSNLLADNRRLHAQNQHLLSLAAKDTAMQRIMQLEQHIDKLRADRSGQSEKNSFSSEQPATHMPLSTEFRQLQIAYEGALQEIRRLQGIIHQMNTPPGGNISQNRGHSVPASQPFVHTSSTSRPSNRTLNHQNVPRNYSQLIPITPVSPFQQNPPSQAPHRGNPGQQTYNQLLENQRLHHQQQMQKLNASLMIRESQNFTGAGAPHADPKLNASIHGQSRSTDTVSSPIPMQNMYQGQIPTYSAANQASIMPSMPSTASQEYLPASLKAQHPLLTIQTTPSLETAQSLLATPISAVDHDGRPVFIQSMPTRFPLPDETYQLYPTPPASAIPPMAVPSNLPMLIQSELYTAPSDNMLSDVVDRICTPIPSRKSSSPPGSVEIKTPRDSPLGELCTVVSSPAIDALKRGSTEISDTPALPDEPRKKMRLSDVEFKLESPLEISKLHDEHEDEGEGEEDEEVEIEVGPDGLRLVADCLAQVIADDEVNPDCKTCRLCTIMLEQGMLDEAPTFVNPTEEELVQHFLTLHPNAWADLREDLC